MLYYNYILNTGAIDTIIIIINHSDFILTRDERLNSVIPNQIPISKYMHNL